MYDYYCFLIIFLGLGVCLVSIAARVFVSSLIRRAYVLLGFVFLQMWVIFQVGKEVLSFLCRTNALETWRFHFLYEIWTNIEIWMFCLVYVQHACEC